MFIISMAGHYNSTLLLGTKMLKKIEKTVTVYLIKTLCRFIADK